MESVTKSVIICIDLRPSSFDGIGYSISSGFELVSTIPTTGIPNFLASATAIFSLCMSTINKTDGNSLISLIPEKNLFRRPLSASSFCDSRFV